MTLVLKKSWVSFKKKKKKTRPNLLHGIVVAPPPPPQSVSFFLSSRSKSRTNSLVSSVPFLLPAAQTSRVSDALIRHTTPPVGRGGRDWFRRALLGYFMFDLVVFSVLNQVLEPQHKTDSVLRLNFPLNDLKLKTRPFVLTWSSALQRHHVSQPGSRLQVPQFDRPVVGAGQNQTSAELQARHRRLVLVGTWEEKIVSTSSTWTQTKVSPCSSEL